MGSDLFEDDVTARDLEIGRRLLHVESFDLAIVHVSRPPVCKKRGEWRLVDQKTLFDARDREKSTYGIGGRVMQRIDLSSSRAFCGSSHRNLRKIQSAATRDEVMHSSPSFSEVRNNSNEHRMKKSSTFLSWIMRILIQLGIYLDLKVVAMSRKHDLSEFLSIFMHV